MVDPVLHYCVFVIMHYKLGYNVHYVPKSLVMHWYPATVKLVMCTVQSVR